MTMEMLLASINYFARQAKERPLTPEEIALRQALRESYIAMIRQAFQSQLEQVTVVDILGNDVTPQQLKDLKRDKERANDLPDRMQAYLDSLPQYDQ